MAPVKIWSAGRIDGYCLIETIIMSLIRKQKERNNIDIICKLSNKFVYTIVYSAVVVKTITLTDCSCPVQLSTPFQCILLHDANRSRYNGLCSRS